MTSRRLPYVVAVILVTLLACGVRLYAAQRLNVDYDEPVYLGDAVTYAGYMRAGDFKMLAWNETTYEHPALYKILYGMVLLTRPPLNRLPLSDLPRLAPITATEAGRWNAAGRYLSVFWGSLAVLVLAVANPLAGLFLGVDTLSVKYTSEVYLEALPLLSSLLCALAYVRWFALVRAEPGPRHRHLSWLMLSAAFLGITAASKYVYCVVGLAIVIHFVVAAMRRQIAWRLVSYLGIWAVVALVMFFVFDPYLWPHPLHRLSKSILFHEEFRDSRLVQQYHYPFWQPLRWLSVFSSSYDLGPASAFPINIDAIIFLLAVVGLPGFYRRQPFFFYWLAAGLLFLLAWTTKWPQYTVIILAPFSMAAAQGAAFLWSLVRRSVGGDQGNNPSAEPGSP